MAVREPRIRTRNDTVSAAAREWARSRLDTIYVQSLICGNYNLEYTTIYSIRRTTIYKIRYTTR